MRKRFTLKMHDYIHHPKGKLEYNEKVFKEIAPKYDFITVVLSLGRDSKWKDHLVEKLPDIRQPYCLDLACGTGDITFRLAEKYPEGCIVGLDLTDAMVAVARSRNCYDNVRFTIKDMSQTGFADNSFDIVTGGYALRNAPDIEVALEEVWRVMKVGGTAAFLDFSRPCNKYFQKIEYWLLKLWGGFWGWLLHRNVEVYTYIAESTKLFADSKQLKQLMTDKGFSNIKSKKYYWGIMESISFEKTWNRRI